MKGFLIALFLLLALSAGLLVGVALAGMLPRRGKPRRGAFAALGLGTLLGLSAAALYIVILRPGAGTTDNLNPSTFAAPWEKYQFELDRIKIPRAEISEPVRKSVSIPVALAYLDQGAEVWNRKYQCIGCHVNGSYLMLRPALSRIAGVPPQGTRDFFLTNLGQFMGKKGELLLLTGNRFAQTVWAAAGLASWDAHVSGTLSPETVAVLSCMLRLRREKGEWLIPHCWPPLQSDAFQLATVAAWAAGTAPGWMEKLKDPELKNQLDLLKRYLIHTDPPHEYARVWLLWAATRFPGILSADARAAARESIFKRQHGDGGWAIRDFAAPGEWGDGSRQNQLETEPDRSSPASDGHMTGLAVCVLRDAGIPAADPRIQKAVNRLLASQRESGRWWSGSLNTDTYHFLTYSATCFALTALWKCEWPPLQARTIDSVSRVQPGNR